MAIGWDHFREDDVGWRSDRLSLALLLPVGAHGVFWVHTDYWRLDTGDLSVLQRWPHLRVEEDEGTPEGWPGESQIAGFGRPELGIMFPLRLPLAGRGHLGLLAGLPVGRDELYPVSAAALPLRLDWRRSIPLSTRLSGAVRIGFEHTFDSGQDYLQGAAFPDGWRFGLELSTDDRQRHGVALAWSARELTQGHHQRRARLTGWLPLQENHLLELNLMRDLGGRADRYATWVIGLSWRLAGLPRDDSLEDEGRGQNARPDGRP
jgi:hypothetical protein